MFDFCADILWIGRQLLISYMDRERTF